MTSNNLPDEFPKKHEKYYTIDEVINFSKVDRLKIARGIWGLNDE